MFGKSLDYSSLKFVLTGDVLLKIKVIHVYHRYRGRKYPRMYSCITQFYAISVLHDVVIQFYISLPLPSPTTTQVYFRSTANKTIR